MSVDVSVATPFDRLVAVLNLLAKVAAVIAVPLVLAYAGYRVEQAIAQQSHDQEYVQLAISILTDPGDDAAADREQLRDWAVNVVNQFAPVPLEESTQEALRDGTEYLPPRLDFSAVSSLQTARSVFEPVARTPFVADANPTVRATTWIDERTIREIPERERQRLMSVLEQIE